MQKKGQMNKENEIQSSIQKTLTFMKEDLNDFQNQNIKTGCSILDLTVLVTITHPLEEKSFADE